MSCPVTNRVNIDALSNALKAQQSRISTLEADIRNLSTAVQTLHAERQAVMTQLQLLMAKVS